MKLFLLLLITINSFAVSIYGEDNRKDWYEITDNKLKTLSLSTAVRILKSQVYSKGETYKFRKASYVDKNKKRIYLPHTLGLMNNMCRGEKFVDQLAEGSCSGFLIADDKLLTAGHCVANMDECNASLWIFDYKMDKQDSSLQEGSWKNVYSCKSILKSKQSKNWLGLGKHNHNSDYAIIQLSRSTGREPFKLADRKPQVGTNLTLVGYPSGLPLKIADEAKVKSINRKVFNADLDAFGGNSGSPVLDSETLEVVGILTAGGEDYKTIREKILIPNEGRAITRKCNTVQKYNIEEVPGENIGLVNKL